MIHSRFGADIINSRFGALGGSVVIHGLLLAALLYTVLPAELPPQQFVEVTLVAGAPAELPQPKPVVEKKAETEMPRMDAPAQPDSVPLPQKKEQAKPVEKKPEQPPETKQETKPEKLSELSPAAGSNNVSAVTTKPQFDAAYLRNPAPEYPAQAKRRHMEGSVMLDVLVSPDGQPRSVTIAQSSGFSLLDDSAKSAVSRWKFLPARKGTETVEARVMVPIEFKLQ